MGGGISGFAIEREGNSSVLISDNIEGVDITLKVNSVSYDLRSNNFSVFLSK